MRLGYLGKTLGRGGLSVLIDHVDQLDAICTVRILPLP